MKQDITKEQRGELSHNQKTYFWHVVDGGVITASVMNLPYPSIGEMIAFLGKELFEIRQLPNERHLEVITIKMFSYRGQELADSLWAACKAKLEYKRID